MIHTAHKR